MKIKILSNNSNISLAVVAIGIAMMVSVFAATLARADAAPTMTVAILNAGNATTTSAQIGSLVYASVNVASSTSSTIPSGTVNFNLYANTACSGAAAVQSDVALANGFAQSNLIPVPSSGLSYLINYNGDASNTPSSSTCVALTATASTTLLSTTLSTTSALAGSSVFDSATLAGITSNASGTLVYNIYSDNACSALTQSAGAVAVTNGIVSNSSTIVFNTPNTYYWQAVYSGDTNNLAATSSCGSEILTVAATTTPPVATTTGMISGEVYNDLNNNNILDSGEPGLAGFTVQLSGASKNYRGSNTTQEVIATTVTDANGNYSFSNLTDGTYKVEEIDQSGWIQETSDFNAVVISNGSSQTGLNFANASTTNNTKHGSSGNNVSFSNGQVSFCNGFPFCNGNPFGNGFPFTSGTSDNNSNVTNHNNNQNGPQQHSAAGGSQHGNGNGRGRGDRGNH
jgi:hypothetical protein